MTSPLVSVIIPAYHRPMLLRERAIPSVLRQSYSNWEIVVVGDGPGRTALADVVKGFGDSRIHYAEIARPDYSGLSRRKLWFTAGAAARNHALSLARGEIIAPLDDDDEFTPNHLAESVAVVASGAADLVYGNVIVRDLETGTEYEDYRPWHEPETRERFLHTNVIYNCSVCFSARFAHLSYHESGDVCCDHGIWLDILNAGGRFASIETPQAIYYGNNLSSDLRISLPGLPRIDAFQDIVADIFECRKLSGFGPQARALESAIAGRLGVAHAVPTASRDLAFFATFSALRERIDAAKTEVVMPSYAPPSLAKAAVLSGFQPVFCDVDGESLVVTRETIQAIAGSQTAIVAAVHSHGVPADMPALAGLAAELDAALIADAGAALGATIDGRAVGTFGAAEILDLGEAAQLTAGEGGAICTQDDAIAIAVRRFVRGGLDADGDIGVLGVNAELGELPAALAIAGLPRLERSLAKRRRMESLYCERLRDVPMIRFIRPTRPELVSASADMVLVLPDPETANRLVSELAGYRVVAGPGYRPLHRMPAFRESRRSTLATTERITECVVRLPLYNDIREEVVNFVADVIRETLR